MVTDLGMKWDSIPEISLKDLCLLPKKQKKGPAVEILDSESDNDSFDEDSPGTDSEERNEEPEQAAEMPLDVAEDIVFGAEPPQAEIPANSIFVWDEELGMVLKKTTLMWGLLNKRFRLSSDREVRVTEAEDTLRTASRSSVSAVLISDELNMGDWCVFKNCPRSNHFLVGWILSFTYLSGKGQSRVYSRRSAPVSAPETVDPKGIGCLATWYTVEYEGDGTLLRYNEPTTFHTIDRYKCTLPKPFTQNGVPQYPENVLVAVSKIMKRKRKTVRPPPTQGSQTTRRTRSSANS